MKYCTHDTEERVFKPIDQHNYYSYTNIQIDKKLTFAYKN